MVDFFIHKNLANKRKEFCLCHYVRWSVFAFHCDSVMFALQLGEGLVMYKIKGFLSENDSGSIVADAESLKTARAKAKGMREIGMRVEITDAHDMPVPEQKED
jgi:hypothetical protein